MFNTLRRRFVIALALSLAVHAVVVIQLAPVAFSWNFSQNVERVTVSRGARIARWIVPTPSPTPVPPDRWKQLDRSMVKKIRLSPADEQIVVLAAKQGNGAPSRAPHILRVEIHPGVVHGNTIMHIKVLAWGGGIQGVYVRFLIWEVGVPPVGAYRLPPSDPDYPGHRYVLFERDYRVPPIPRLYRGRTYQAEVIATGRQGIASGAFVPLRVL